MEQLILQQEIEKREVERQIELAKIDYQVYGGNASESERSCDDVKISSNDKTNQTVVSSSSVEATNACASESLSNLLSLKNCSASFAVSTELTSSGMTA